MTEVIDVEVAIFSTLLVIQLPGWLTGYGSPEQEQAGICFSWLKADFVLLWEKLALYVNQSGVVANSLQRVKQNLEIYKKQQREKSVLLPSHA